MLNVKCQVVSNAKCQMSTAYVDPWDMLNNYCFHVYAQKWHMWNVKCQMSIVKCQVASVKCQMLMLILVTYWTTFVFMSMLKCGICEMSSVKCQMSSVKCQMWNVNCLCWSLGHAEQLLFSCLCSNVAVDGWKYQWFFLTASPCPVSGPIIELVPS